MVPRYKKQETIRYCFWYWKLLSVNISLQLIQNAFAFAKHICNISDNLFITKQARQKPVLNQKIWGRGIRYSLGCVKPAKLYNQEQKCRFTSRRISTVTSPRCYKDSYVNCFMSPVNSLFAEYFPLTYDLNCLNCFFAFFLKNLPIHAFHHFFSFLLFTLHTL